MKTLLLFIAVPASFAVYFLLVKLGVFQKTAWPHYGVALVAIAGLVSVVLKNPGGWNVGALGAAVALTGLMAWWMFSYSEYGQLPEVGSGKTLPLDAVPGLQEAVAGRERTELVFYRGHW